MTGRTAARTPVRLHLTNVTGAGAVQLLQSLLPALEADPQVVIERLHLPERGPLSAYRGRNAWTSAEVYRRYLPNALSRIAECTWAARQFDGESPLLVFGDLPLRCRAPQTVLLQQSNLLAPPAGTPRWSKYAVGRALFRSNVGHVKAFIVQTEVMRAGLERSYPGTAGRVHVVAQPVPSWLLHSGLRRRERAGGVGQGLRLVYPAAGYPHKNHSLLAKIDDHAQWPVERLDLTLDRTAHPAPRVPWLHCRGFLAPAAMVEAYAAADALLFLSKEESYGFPLVEAMFVGLPIVCPDRDYAHVLCGDQALYFDPDDPASLHGALVTLRDRLASGWWPDWRARLQAIPPDWATVARRMLDIACGIAPQRGANANASEAFTSTCRVNGPT